jgi:hypothetical protein
LAEFERAQLGEFSSWASDGFLNGWWGVLAGQRAVHWIEYQPA